jgi:hypothetical protein
VRRKEGARELGRFFLPEQKASKKLASFASGGKVASSILVFGPQKSETPKLRQIICSRWYELFRLFLRDSIRG